MAKSKTNTKTIVTIVLLVLLLIVIIQNSEETPTVILFWTITMPRALLLGITLLIGIVMGLLMRRKKEKKA